jgi:hypothetical protein
MPELCFFPGKCLVRIKEVTLIPVLQNSLFINAQRVSNSLDQLLYVCTNIICILTENAHINTIKLHGAQILNNFKKIINQPPYFKRTDTSSVSIKGEELPNWQSGYQHVTEDFIPLLQ